MSVVNTLFINISLLLGLPENRALGFKVKRNGLFSCLTFIVILFYSYGIHVKNPHLNMTLIKRQNKDFKVQIQCHEIKSEKARDGKNLMGHHYHRHQHPIYFCGPYTDCRAFIYRACFQASCFRKYTEQPQINQIWVMMGTRTLCLKIVFPTEVCPSTPLGIHPFTSSKSSKQAPFYFYVSTFPQVIASEMYTS